ncbi:hypothetical protein RHGRI_016922 [Rhododendron griersonianum]|uniref:G-patch domain-containing protein n=1 Tax=Rhododendron griersonianum TaxID=479676 RepID=A0AAV6JVV3_9ERIC|nr:hypothetical protein RHGRI_016922 [Rhododendron griersonianum]
MVLSQAAPNFETFYDSGLAVEEVLRDGTLERKELAAKPKRVYSGNSNVLFGNSNQAGTSSTKPAEVNQISKKPKSQQRAFTQFNTPRSALLKKLTEVGVLNPLQPPQNIPPNLNQNVYCDFHQMHGHTTDNCICLRHEIQNLIDNKVIDTPPSDKPNTMTNPLPQHNAPFHINQITQVKSQDFDPTSFIIPDTEPEPIVEIPEEIALCYLWDWGDLIADWKEFEVANFQEDVNPFFEPGWEVDWQNIYADPLDGFSLNMMFNLPEMPEWEWNPIPDEYQLLAWNDPLDTFSIPMLFAEEYQPPAVIYNWPEPVPFRPNLSSYLYDLIANDPYNNVGLAPYPEPPGPEEDVASNEFNPMDYLVDEIKSESSVTFPKDADVAMMNLWEDEPGAKTNLWGNTEIINIKVGNEEWTVNRAVAEAEKWKPEDLWEDLVVADLAANLQDTTIGNKRKALADLWNEESKYQQIGQLTRSGRIYQPPNLQIGESSNPSAPLTKEPSNPFVIPIKDTFQPFAPPVKEPSRPEKDPERMIKRQLEQSPTKMSVWDVLVHSTRHCEGFIQALSHLKVLSAITPDELVALIKTIPVKHAITFTDRDLPAEGTDHNRPLHITLKCHGKWVPVILIDNGSAINVCPLRVAYCLGYKNSDFSPSEVKVRAYDNTRRDVTGTLMLPMTFGHYQTDVEFHVVNIPASFNLLLGRPWMHRPNIMAVPSTLHQKVRLGLETGMLTIHGDSMIRAPVEDNAPLLEIQHGEEDIALGGFSLDTSRSVFTVKIDDDFVVSNVAIKIMKKMSYMPGLGLGKNLQGPAQFEEPGTLTRVTGVGYHPSEDRKEKKGDRLEDYFVKEKAKQIYQGQPEPFWDKETKTFLPGFEIFANDVWPESDEELKAVIKPVKTTDWVETLVVGSLATLFEEDEPLGIVVEAEV